MANFFKYLPVSANDARWGTYMVNTGFNSISQNSNYPLPGHPADYQFDWRLGRVLDEFQIIYITKGRGIFESRNHAPTTINPGTLILLLPGEWHRFRPDSTTGWDEYWIGFKGSVIDHIEEEQFLSAKDCILQIGLRPDILSLFECIIAEVIKEQQGYQQYVGGIILHLLGYMHYSLRQQKTMLTTTSNSLIERAILLLRERVCSIQNTKTIARELNVGYASFRKTFKVYTGLAPHQYLLNLKLEYSKSLLTCPEKSLKEIAYELGFSSPFYYSKIFKIKTGISPDGYRKRILH